MVCFSNFEVAELIKRVLPCLDQQQNFLFIQYDFVTSSTMWNLAVTTEIKVAISTP